jgi:amino-acid N-acetyltransferase
LASAADLAPIEGLLVTAHLPTDDLASARPEFVVARDGAALIGAGALQRFGPAALLRSVVVADSHRSRGIGRRIVGALERLAEAQGVAQLFLLTETAENFFKREGYHKIERASAPAPLQSTAEFRSLCPSSAACMTKQLPKPEAR